MENRVIYLVRHGKIHQEDEQRRYIGQIDLPLTEEGIRQAQNLQRRFESTDISAVFCSDLRRSVDTAKIIAGSREIRVVVRQDLREVCMGEWEGCKFGEIAQRYPEEFRARGADIANYRVPGGESFADCSSRVIAALESILASTAGNLVIVGHAGANRLLLCHVLGMPIANVFRIGQDYGCLNIIQCGTSGYQAKLINGRGRTNRR